MNPTSRRVRRSPVTIALGLAMVGLLGSSACASTKTADAKSPAKKTTTTKKATPPANKGTTKATTRSTVKATASSAVSGQAVDASMAIDVPFDTPGAKPRPLNEVTVPVSKPVTTLTMNVTNIAYRGLVCGFSFRGQAPKSPVTIRMQGASRATSFDSGALAVSWTGLDSDLVKADSGSNNSWSFSSEAHVNRTGPGWVISLGGVTAEAPDVVPTRATCQLELREPLVPANGPIGYWAGFAAV